MRFQPKKGGSKCAKNAALQRGSFTNAFLCKFYKRSWQEQKDRPREEGEEQSLGEQPQGMSSI